MKRIKLDQLDGIILGPPGKWRSLRALVFAYVVFSIIAHMMSGVMLYPIPAPYYSDTEEIIKISTDGGKQISAMLKENPQAKYTILFSHGNAEDLGAVQTLLVDLRDAGFNVFAYDYHGYGTSEGRPTEARTYMDIHAAYMHLTEVIQIPEESIILYGRSLGCGPTIELARQKTPAALILEAPFVSAYRVITRIPLFPFDKYKNIKKIQGVAAPLLFIYSENDRVIAPANSKQLFAKATSEIKELHMVEGVGHNDLHAMAGHEVIEAIVRFVDRVENPEDE